jgi:hypothetical protein
MGRARILVRLPLRAAAPRARRPGGLKYGPELVGMRRIPLVRPQSPASRRSVAFLQSGGSTEAICVMLGIRRPWPFTGAAMLVA